MTSTLLIRVGMTLALWVVHASFVGAQTVVSLQPSAYPGTGQAGSSYVALIAANVPAGTIGSGGITVSLEPALAGRAPRSSVPAYWAAQFFSWGLIVFKIPQLDLAEPTAYYASIAGTTPTGSALTSSNASGLTIVPPASITAITPSEIPVGQVASVSLTGSYTNFLHGITLASFGPGISVGGAPEGGWGPVTVTSPTTAVARIAVAAGASLGPRPLTVKTGLQEATMAKAVAVTRCIADVFDVRVTAPADGEILQRDDTLVKGHVPDTSGEVGVLVNGLPAEINGPPGAAGFAAAHVSLAPGSNTITVSATNACGQNREQRVAVSVPSVGPVVHLDVHPVSDPPPLAVQLRVNDAHSRPIVRYQWDFTGDGIVDAEGAALPEVPTTYEQKGLFTPTVTLIDDQQHTYTATAVVNVFSPEARDRLLRDKWEGLKASLASGDIDAAVAKFADGAQAQYRESFVLMRDLLPQIAAELGELRLVRFVDGGAIYELVGVRDGAAYSSHVEFVQDTDGLWKIRFF